MHCFLGSLLFPLWLEASTVLSSIMNHCCRSCGDRIVQQVSYSYYGIKPATEIILHETCLTNVWKWSLFQVINVGGMFNLPHIWHRVLLNTPSFTLKRHAQAVGHANSNQSNTPFHLNQPNIPTHLGQPNSPMKFFTGAEHVHRTSYNPYKAQHLSSHSDLIMSSCWMDESLSSTTNVLFQRIFQLLNDTTEWEIYTKLSSSLIAVGKRITILRL